VRTRRGDRDEGWSESEKTPVLRGRPVRQAQQFSFSSIVLTAEAEDDFSTVGSAFRRIRGTELEFVLRTALVLLRTYWSVLRTAITRRRAAAAAARPSDSTKTTEPVVQHDAAEQRPARHARTVESRSSSPTRRQVSCRAITEKKVIIAALQ